MGSKHFRPLYVVVPSAPLVRSEIFICVLASGRATLTRILVTSSEAG